MILVIFEYQGDPVEIRLKYSDNRDQFIVYARYSPHGGHVNGYSYVLDNVFELSLKDAAKLDVIQHLAEAAKQHVLDGSWEKYEKAVEELKAKNEPK